MKLCLAVIAIFAAVEAGSIGCPSVRLPMNVMDMIREFGYPVQNVTVQTSDGYMLQLMRIPGGRGYRDEFEQKWRERRGDEVRTDKPVVLLMHAMLSSCEDFVVGGPTEALALVLADNGYDVFLGNVRGSKYGRMHTVLNPERDPSFWNFCWHDIGIKDLPAIMDKVMVMSQQSTMALMGHMEGTTPMYVMGSEMPKYNEKVSIAISMGPVAFMKGTRNVMFKTISEHYKSKSWVMKNLGMNEFHPTTEFISQVNTDCMKVRSDERMCQNPFFVVNGYETEQMNMTTINCYISHVPAGASTKQVLHYSQLVATGRFETYYTDNVLPREYDLSRVTMPMVMMYVPTDRLSMESDVKMLMDKLPPTVDKISLTDMTNDLDLLYSNNVRNLVYRTIMDILEKRMNE